MNAQIDSSVAIVAVAAIIAESLGYVVYRVVRTVRGKHGTCCSDNYETKKR